MAQKTLKEIAMMYARKQPQQVEYLTEEAPFIAAMPFEPASHGFWNSYEEITGINGASVVQMDAPLPDLDVSSDLKKVDLELFGGKIQRGEDAVKVLGGFAKYLAKNEQHIMNKFGQDAEQRILYKYFRQFAIDNGAANTKLLYKGTNAAANTGWSIIAVRFSPSVTTGLYNPDGFGQGTMLNYSPINGGALYDIGNGVLGYGGRYKSNIGVQIASPKTVGAMVNIDLTADTGDFGSTKMGATLNKIDNMLSDIRATPASTMLVMHQRVLNGMYNAKSEKLMMAPMDKDLNRMVNTYNGIPIMVTYNMLEGSEAIVA